MSRRTDAKSPDANQPERPDRRGFLKGAGAVAGGAVVGAPVSAKALTAPNDWRAPRYRETDHVRAHYRTSSR